MANRYIVISAFAFALTWLLPNHYPPWFAFYKDYYAAAFLCLFLLIFLTYRKKINGTICGTTVAILFAFSTVPLLQHSLGVISFFGQALISFAYLFGFALAIVIAAQFAKAQEWPLVTVVLGGLLVAAIVSVFIQLSTWLGVASDSYTDILILSHAGSRPSANLGQANQLAMLLCLGLLASLWFLKSNLFGTTVWLMIAAILCIGIALTQSRAGILIVSFSALFGPILAYRIKEMRVAVLLATLPFLLFISYSGVDSLSEIYFDSADDVFGTRGNESISQRFDAWKLFASSILSSPWHGFGLTDLGWVHILHSPDSQRWGVVFFQSHNIGLDLALWLGIPLTIVIIGCFLLWLFRCMRAIADAQTLIIFLAVCGLLIHASVELPLHYAYFLLPFGIFLGTLDGRTSQLSAKAGSFTLSHSRLLLLATLPLLALIYWDYSIVDEEYRQARFSAANFTYAPPDQSARILVLDHARDYVRLVRLKPEDVLEPGELKRLNLAALHFGSVGVFYNLAIINHRAGHPEEAAALIRHGCVIATEEICSVLRSEFTRMTVSTPPIN